MAKDLQRIKSKYGEKMMKLCRDNFIQILDDEGVLSQILEQYFYPQRKLAEDLIEQNRVDSFKQYIFSKVKIQDKASVKTGLSAAELMDQAGYILYPECKTESDIQAFRHYYHRKSGETPVYVEGENPELRNGEELCTFNGGRLHLCRVWFAVKKNVDEIKRENFEKPDRQDEYGTSVISIQFTKFTDSILTIKNRYNHKVVNPDNTFNSNLENIIEGLSDAFERDFGVKSYVRKCRELIDLKGYVMACDGKYYPYNYKINDIYYCPDNIIIDKVGVHHLPKDHLILADYFIIDTQKKTVKLYDQSLQDSFIKYLSNLKKIDINKNQINFEKTNGEKVSISLDNLNRITALSDEHIVKFNYGADFMSYNNALESLNFPNLKECGDDFLRSNKTVREINFPLLQKCGRYFLSHNTALNELNLPELKECGFSFVRYNKSINKVNLPKLQYCDDYFLSLNEKLTNLSLLELKQCGRFFLSDNESIESVELPELQVCGTCFLYCNKEIAGLNLPKLEISGNYFMYKNKLLRDLNMPNLRKRQEMFLSSLPPDVRKNLLKKRRMTDCFKNLIRNLKFDTRAMLAKSK